MNLNGLQHAIYSPIFTEPIVMKVEIKGDKLTMTADSGRKEVYVRK